MTWAKPIAPKLHGMCGKRWNPWRTGSKIAWPCMEMRLIMYEYAQFLHGWCSLPPLPYAHARSPTMHILLSCCMPCWGRETLLMQCRLRRSQWDAPNHPSQHRPAQSRKIRLHSIYHTFVALADGRCVISRLLNRLYLRNQCGGLRDEGEPPPPHLFN